MSTTHLYSECADPQSCALHRREPAPSIPDSARPYIAAWLRWMGNDDGAHGGAACRFDRNWLLETADDVDNATGHAARKNGAS